MTNANSYTQRRGLGLVRIAAIGAAALLTTACSELSTAPSAAPASTAVRTPTELQLTPTEHSNVARSGYMLSSGFAGNGAGGGAGGGYKAK